MDRSRVACVRLDDYEASRASAAVRRAVDLLGGADALIRPGSRVFIKINHLSPATPPEKAVITHPEIVAAVAGLLLDLGCAVTVGDDISSAREDGFDISGYRSLCRRLGVRLLNLKEAGFRQVACRGEVLTSVFLSTAALNADHIVNVPKLKTHAYTALTAAVKNLYGLIPHGPRLDYHRRFHDPLTFARALLDICAALPPSLHIVDGVVAMEGAGPAGGLPRPLGVLLAGADPIAVDAAAGRLAGYGADDVLTTALGRDRGLGRGLLGDIEFAGDPLDSFVVRDFKRPRLALGLVRRRIPAGLYAVLQSSLVTRPSIDDRSCTRCGECAAICPQRAVRTRGGRLAIDRSACIHCLCCHEVCRHGAVRLRETALGYMVRRAANAVEIVGRLRRAPRS